MKLTKRPKELFHGGHSGRRFGASDLPKLRAMRDAYRSLIATAREIQSTEKDPAMLLASATVIASLQACYDSCGQALDLIERTPPNWRPA